MLPPLASSSARSSWACAPAGWAPGGATPLLNSHRPTLPQISQGLSYPTHAPALSPPTPLASSQLPTPGHWLCWQPCMFFPISLFICPLAPLMKTAAFPHLPDILHPVPFPAGFFSLAHLIIQHVFYVTSLISGLYSDAERGCMQSALY